MHLGGSSWTDCYLWSRNNIFMEERIKEMYKYFGVYGHGNFDLTIKDIIDLLKALHSDNYINELKDLYVRLEQQRMG
jgi:hypothetical protein